MAGLPGDEAVAVSRALHSITQMLGRPQRRRRRRDVLSCRQPALQSAARASVMAHWFTTPPHAVGPRASTSGYFLRTLPRWDFTPDTRRPLMSSGSTSEYDPSLPSRCFFCSYVLPAWPANRTRGLLTDPEAPERRTRCPGRMASSAEADSSQRVIRPKPNGVQFRAPSLQILGSIGVNPARYPSKDRIPVDSGALTRQ